MLQVQINARSKNEMLEINAWSKLKASLIQTSGLRYWEGNKHLGFFYSRKYNTLLGCRYAYREVIN